MAHASHESGHMVMQAPTPFMEDVYTNVNSADTNLGQATVTEPNTYDFISLSPPALCDISTHQPQTGGTPQSPSTNPQNHQPPPMYHYNPYNVEGSLTAYPHDDILAQSLRNALETNGNSGGGGGAGNLDGTVIGNYQYGGGGCGGEADGDSGALSLPSMHELYTGGHATMNDQW